jgi:TRAP-type C4-dicarboxylate transport system permease small subunit
VTEPVTKLTNMLENILALLLFAMFLMIATLVLLRYVFATTIIGGNEATIVAFIYTTAIGASIAVSRDEHIAITYFTDKLSPDAQQLLSRVRLVLLTVLNVTIAFLAISWIRRTGGFLMPTLGVPQLVAQLSVPLSGTLSALYCLVRLLR